MNIMVEYMIKNIKTMEEYLPLIIQLASDAIRGNLAGSLLKSSSMGTLWNFRWPTR